MIFGSHNDLIILPFVFIFKAKGTPPVKTPVSFSEEILHFLGQIFVDLESNSFVKAQNVGHYVISRFP